MIGIWLRFWGMGNRLGKTSTGVSPQMKQQGLILILLYIIIIINVGKAIISKLSPILP
jgi:hypothetical protein